jgi:hypothetical protein
VTGRQGSIAGLAAVGLLLMSCSTDRPATGADTPVQAGVGESVPAASTEPGPLPALQVRDVRTGASIDLAGLLPADRPLLLWFWAPH